MNEENSIEERAKENGNQLATPGSYDYITSQFAQPDVMRTFDGGLTKREHFAAMALQALCAGRTVYDDPRADVDYAVRLADLLLKELQK